MKDIMLKNSQVVCSVIAKEKKRRVLILENGYDTDKWFEIGRQKYLTDTWQPCRQPLGISVHCIHPYLTRTFHQKTASGFAGARKFCNSIFTRSPIFVPSRAHSVRSSSSTKTTQTQLLHSSSFFLLLLLLDPSMPNIRPTVPRRIQHSRNRSVRSYAGLTPRFPSISLGYLGIGLLRQRAGARDLLGSRARSRSKEKKEMEMSRSQSRASQRRSGRYNSRDIRAKRPSERNEWVRRSRRMIIRPILRSG